MSILTKLLGNDITFCYHKTNNKNRGLILDKKLDELAILRLNKREKKDVYFYINQSGKANKVYKFRALFLDFDIGKNSKTGKYYTDHNCKTLKDYKVSVLKVINDFNSLVHVTPSIVNETRNGFQVIWFVSENSINSLDTFNKLQKKLYYWFKSNGVTPDSNCLRPNQFFRVPNSIWYKPWENLPPFKSNSQLINSSFKKLTVKHSKKLIKFLLEYSFESDDKDIYISPSGCLMPFNKNKNKEYKKLKTHLGKNKNDKIKELIKALLKYLE